MKNQSKTLRLVLAGALCTAGLGGVAYGQSADALINKLVNKGVLTVKEANDLRQEADKGFSKAYAAKTGMPNWVTALKMNGDFRGRYEGFYARNPAAVDRHRFQYRLRYGIAVDMLDRYEVGLRLASIGDTANNPISSNQTLDNNATKKGLALDQIYGKWTPDLGADWKLALTLGKMENPFSFSPNVFDPDYTPEGLAQQLTYHLNPNHALKLNLGEFVLEERSGSYHDSYLLGAQVRLDSKWGKHWTTAASLGALVITDKSSLIPGNGQLNIGEGNTRGGVGPASPFGLANEAPLYNFTPIVASAEIGYVLESFPLYKGHFPLKLGGEYLNNVSARQDNEGYSVKLTLGKAGKKGLWEMGYELRQLQANAIYEELPESDFNAYTQTALTTPSGGFSGVGGFVNGTNVRGHIIRLGYSVSDSVTLGLAYWMTENIRENPIGSSSAANRLQLDIVWKF